MLHLPAPLLLSLACVAASGGPALPPMTTMTTMTTRTALASVARTASEPASSSTSGSASSWTLPVPAGQHRRRFDPPAKRWLTGHRGVDLSGQAGQPVLAAGAGVVLFAGQIAGRGVVVVAHGSLRTTYEPVLATVHQGDQVLRGAPIGRLELSGSHCLPEACLHWGLRRGEDYLDPWLLIRRAPARLVAVWPRAAGRGG